MVNDQPPAPAGGNDTGAKTYKIRTLGDIFALPTYEQMEVCLAELGKMMLQVRATNDLMVGFIGAAHAEAIPGILFKWPETTTWIDDGKGEITARFMHEGEELMRLELRKKIPTPAPTPEQDGGAK